MKVAVIGAGVAGIVTSYLLDRKYKVTLYEADKRLGGHTSTVEHNGYAIDTGFIVLNNQNYPLFNKFLSALNVNIRNSDMSFGYECRTSGFSYAGTDLNGLFAQRKNLFSVSYYSFLREIYRFSSNSIKQLENLDHKITLQDFLLSGKYSEKMQQDYLLPMAAAIWSCPLEQVLKFPAKSFLSFFKNHGLLSLDNRPQWQTVAGGSFSYLKAFEKVFSGTIHLDSPVLSVDSDLNLKAKNHEAEKYDYIVFACHADQVLKILTQPNAIENKLFGSWRYQENKTILHTDISYLPLNKRAWASWNYIREKQECSAVTVTYHMNRLQGIEAEEQFCVTLNPVKPIPRGKIIKEFIYHHPLFNQSAMESQKFLKNLNTEKKYFCGSYFGYGFHEDAVRSAVQVAKEMGVDF